MSNSVGSDQPQYFYIPLKQSQEWVPTPMATPLGITGGFATAPQVITEAWGLEHPTPGPGYHGDVQGCGVGPHPWNCLRGILIVASNLIIGPI